MKKSKDDCESSAALKRLRGSMGWTQAETATFLGISKKAIESYEQCWRPVPDSVWKELLTLAAVQNHYPHGFQRCFEVLQCPAEARHECFCCKKMSGKFCWMTASTNCHQHHPELKKSFLTCLSCPVVKQFLP